MVAKIACLIFPNGTSNVKLGNSPLFGTLYAEMMPSFPKGEKVWLGEAKHACLNPDRKWRVGQSPGGEAENEREKGSPMARSPGAHIIHAAGQSSPQGDESWREIQTSF